MFLASVWDRVIQFHTCGLSSQILFKFEETWKIWMRGQRGPPIHQWWGLSEWKIASAPTILHVLAFDLIFLWGDLKSPVWLVFQLEMSFNERITVLQGHSGVSRLRRRNASVLMSQKNELAQLMCPTYANLPLVPIKDANLPQMECLTGAASSDLLEDKTLNFYNQSLHRALPQTTSKIVASKNDTHPIPWFQADSPLWTANTIAMAALPSASGKN